MAIWGTVLFGVLAGQAGRGLGTLISTGGLVLMWFDDSFAGLSLVILGWFPSVPGAIIGGLIIGVGEKMA